MYACMCVVKAGIFNVLVVKAQKQGKAEQHPALLGNACFQNSF